MRLLKRKSAFSGGGVYLSSDFVSESTRAKFSLTFGWRLFGTGTKTAMTSPAVSPFLIRHGTTTTSGQTFAGRSNVPLNDEGQRIVEDIMRDLAPLAIERIVSSPLSRAMETARPLAEELCLDIETDPRLMEFDFGDYEGQK